MTIFHFKLKADHEGRVQVTLPTTLADAEVRVMVQVSEPHGEEDTNEAMRALRDRVYALARGAWRALGDDMKAVLTDSELDAEFGGFDAMGIPRLKGDRLLEDEPIGSGAYAARVIRAMGGIELDPLVADDGDTDVILDENFADDLLARWILPDDFSR